MTIRPRTQLRIAQVSPLYESVPPKLYGGTERVVSYLTEELVDLGHDVTLFASGDSQTKARLVPCCPKALRLNPDCIDQLIALRQVRTRGRPVFVERAADDVEDPLELDEHLDECPVATSRRVRSRATSISRISSRSPGKVS